MGKKYDFKYVVIGSGPSGSAAALTLSKAKKRVALIENRYFGGSNLNTRDVPYSVALDFTHTFSKVLSFPEFNHQDLTFNFPTIAARELKTIVDAGGNNKKHFEDSGVICLDGYAHFLDPHTIAINNRKITSEFFIIATGSHLKTNEIFGTDSVGFLTPETAIKSRRLPKILAIVGGGSTGCEIASFYAELGTKVIIFESAERLLPEEDQEVGELLADYFCQKLGVNVFTNAKVVAIQEDNFSKSIIFRRENHEKFIRVDSIVLATGSEPNLDCGLENANVKYKNTGITVNKYFETSAKNIYAVGDCTSKHSSTDRAYHEGLTLATNLVKKQKNLLNYHGFIRQTNTLPEIATVGYTEDDLIKRDRKYKKSLVKLNEIMASKIYNFDHGFIKLLTDKNNRLLGASVVCPHAGLITEELAMAIRHNLTALELAGTPHMMNSYNYLVKLAAKKIIEKK